MSNSSHASGHSIPSNERNLDLTILKGDTLSAAVLSLVQELFPDWANNVESIHLHRVSGALTNAVFFADAANKRRLLLRVYGIGVDQIIDRDKELDWLARLGRLGLGPRLLATFGNGRFEEYLDSTTLNHHDIRDPETSNGIAACLQKLHAIVGSYPPSNGEKLEVWKNVDSWYDIVLALQPILRQKGEVWSKTLEEYNLEALHDQIETCKRILDDKSPVVFAHNDTQYGNVLKLEKSGDLVIVDFEYAGYNTRGFDIANHFCEWMYDYHSDQPALLNPAMFPSSAEQLRFVKAYLATEPITEYQTHDTTPEKLCKEILDWVMASHLMWGLWGLIQASQSEIEFDYFAYSMQRLNAFRSELDKHL